jgi:lysophospholipase L1-like esterase
MMDVSPMPIIAGRRWTGQLMESNSRFRPMLWGFGFDAAGRQVDALGIVLAPELGGATLRIRLWHRRGETVTSPFVAPDESETPLFDRSFDVPPQGREVNRHFQWFDLAGTALLDGLHVCVLSATRGDEEWPLSVGISRWEEPWDWQAGWFCLEGHQPRIAKCPHGLAWLLRGPNPLRKQPWTPGLLVRAEGRIEAGSDPFAFVTPTLHVETLGGSMAIHPRLFQVPAPGSEEGSCKLDAGERAVDLPFRHVEIEETSEPLELGENGSTLVRSDGAAEPALVRYRGWNCRYDLVTLDHRTGSLHLHLGAERALDPEEFPATAPPGHLQVCALYTTFEGVEPIFLGDWRGLVRIGDEERHAHWLEYCRQRLGRTFRRLRAGHDLRIIGYGDSITALGSRHPDLLDAPNGPHRDALGYFECYGSDWKRKQRSLSKHASSDADAHLRFGWNWYLKQHIEDRWPVSVEYLNWGLPGTTSGDGSVLIDGHIYPGAANPDRLARMLRDNPDLVVVGVGTNDVGEPIDTCRNIVAICDIIRSNGADVIVVAPCRPNPAWRSRDPILWQQTYEEVIAGAEEADVAYVPTWEIFGDGNQGALGLSVRSYSAASMGNHPGPRELAAVGALLASIIP